MYLKVKEYDNGKPIIFGLNAMRTPFSVAVKALDIAPTAEAKKLVPEGSFVVSVGDDIRFLPRTRLKLATATNSASITLKAPSASFKIGDVIRAVAGYAELHLSGAAATGDIVTLRVNNVNYSATVEGTQTVAATAALVAALVIPDVTITQVGSTGKVILVAKDSFKLDVFSSSPALVANVYSTEPGYFGDAVLPLGTVLSIAAPNTAGERVITLAGNAAYVLPIDTPVGVTVDKYLGIYPEQLDLTELPVEHIAPIYHADGVYEANLPYCDSQLKRTLSGLNINKKFYANV